MLWTMMPALEVDMPAIDVLRCGDNEGNTPLHLVLAHQIVCTESSLCFLIGNHKDLLRQQNLLGETPAHVTILRKVEVAKLLVSSEVMFLTEYARGHTVLHRQLLASREFVNPDVIAFLIGLDAGILRVPCKYGDFPIHCAVRGTKGAGGVEAVVTCVELLLGDSTVHTYHPKVAVQHQGDIRLLRNGTGFTALRTAVQHSAPHEILTLLVDRNETVLYDRDDKTGFTPLHAFWERPSPIRSVPACIQVLRGKDQGVLLTKNSLGQIPLFHALASIRTTTFEWLVMLLPSLFPDRQPFVGTTSAETAQLHELARIRIDALKRAGALHLLPSQTLFLDNQGMTVIRAAMLHDPGGRRTPPKIIAMLCTHFQDVIPCTYRDPLSSETDLMNALRSGWPAPLLSLLCDFDQHTLFLREKNVDTNNTPLHMYLQRIALTPREERCITVNALVDRHRLILQTQNPDMNTPLHLASMHHTARGCMRVLLFSNYSEEHPDLYAQNIQAALVLQNMQGQTALHLALERFRSMDRDTQIVMWQDICTKLAGTTPEVRLKQDAHGNTPLHVGAYDCLLHTNNNNMSTRMRAVLIDEDREVLTRQNQHGKTALHIVVKMCDVFNFRHSLPFLIDDQENVLFRQDTQLQTPLHCCIRCHTRGAAYDIIQLLIGKSERALTLEDETGSFPLHAALEVGQGDMATLVSLLGKVNSTVISQKKNKAGLKPICLAIINLADIEVVKMLLGFAPLPHKRVEALLETTDGGKTLLHLALSQRAHLPIAELLVDCDKEVLRRLDSVGNTPLHVAVIFGVRASDVGFLIDAKCPNKMLLTANIFGQMPLHMAVSSTHCDYYEEWMQNIETLIDAERTILLKTLPDGMTALHLAIRYLPLHFTDLPNMHLIQSLACLIDMPQQRVLTMANKADGQTPLHLALCHIRHDAGMECVHFIKMLVDPAQVVLRGSGTVPQQNTPLALFQSRVSVMPGRTMHDPAVEAAIVNVLSGSAM
jgi:ankyrin repeat protein